MKQLLLFCSLLLVSACTHSIHMVNVSGFEVPKNSSASRLVEGSSEQFVVLGITDNTQYVDDAVKKLSDQCLEGEIRNLSTQFSTSHGFFSWTNKILIKGFCFRS